MYGRYGVAVLRVHAVRRSQGFRDVELPRLGVDGDDLAGADDPRTLEGRESDAAEADDDYAGAGGNVHRIERRAESGRDAATDQRRAVQRHVVADLHERAFRAQHLLGE